MLTLSNNKVKDWAELERLVALPALEELLLVGNPLWCDFRDNNALSQYRTEARREALMAGGRHNSCAILACAHCSLQ